ncbi:paeninodin family lasso peptide [Sporolactobacillus sp. THM7-4]|nr:paeninodin family lasso peptide [Sporolactobacillus sp. THM7-4]
MAEKLVWTKPELTSLDVKMTQMGPGTKIVDFFLSDNDESVAIHKS